MAAKIQSSPKGMKVVHDTKWRPTDKKEVKISSPVTSFETPVYFSTEKNLLWIAEMFA